MSFIINPNLPSGAVKTVLVSSEAPGSFIRVLGHHGIEVIAVEPCKDVATNLSTHPDMLFHHLGGSDILCGDCNTTAAHRLKAFGFNVIAGKNNLNPKYPSDIAYNAARVGKYLFCNKSYTDPQILNGCGELHIIPVRQGYAKCSVCVVSENAIITADKGIALWARQSGMDVLQISEGNINLPGCNYGFIGGCCGKISADAILFCGNLSLHPDYNKIKRFLHEHGVYEEFTDDVPLTDIGSILPLTEDIMN